MREREEVEWDILLLSYHYSYNKQPGISSMPLDQYDVVSKWDMEVDMVSK